MGDEDSAGEIGDEYVAFQACTNMSCPMPERQTGISPVTGYLLINTINATAAPAPLRFTLGRI